MKIKNGYIILEVAGQTVVLPTGDDLDLNIMITLNGTGAFIWNQLKNETDEAAIVKAMLEEYDVDEARAAQAVANFVQNLRENGFLAE